VAKTINPKTILGVVYPVLRARVQTQLHSLSKPHRQQGSVCEFNPTPSLYHYRARYYDPASGRFISEDPLRLGGGVNIYAYVYNNPINLSDPLGLRACKDATKNCIQRALKALFPGLNVAVGNPTGNPNPDGGHWNFTVQLTFPSLNAANSFLSDYNSQGQAGFTPYTRYPSANKGGIGTTLHLEQLNNSANETTNSDGTVTLAGKAHLDLYDPDTGLAGMMGHGIIDGLMGHIADLLRRNIDPANCPW
jgi:RHS repeat-associated protein